MSNISPKRNSMPTSPPHTLVIPFLLHARRRGGAKEKAKKEKRGLPTNPHLTNRTLLRAHLARQHRLLWHPHLLLLRLGKTHIRLALLRCLCLSEGFVSLAERMVVCIDQGGEGRG